MEPTILPPATDLDIVSATSCQGNKCFWCRLTGRHDQSPIEKTFLLRQMAIGLFAMLVTVAVVMGILFYMAKMLRMI